MGLVTGILGSCLGVVLVLAGGGTAVAQEDYRYLDGPVAWSVASGPACGGRVFSSTVTSTEIFPGPGLPPVDNRGTLHVWVCAMFVGVSENPGVQCSVFASLRWRNLATGASGEVHDLGPVSGSIPPFLGTGASADLDTGSGPVELTLFTDRSHIPGTNVVEVF
ncbi:MAG TPA: hypothetical protein VIW24_09830 [Aldersonia sp.]